MQNKVELTKQALLVLPQGSHKFFAMKSKLKFPLEEVAGASIDPGILDEGKGIRGPKPVVIQLKNAEFARLVWGVEEPEKLVDQINNQLG